MFRTSGRSFHELRYLFFRRSIPATEIHRWRALAHLRTDNTVSVFPYLPSPITSSTSSRSAFGNHCAARTTPRSSDRTFPQAPNLRVMLFAGTCRGRLPQPERKSSLGARGLEGTEYKIRSSSLSTTATSSVESVAYRMPVAVNDVWKSLDTMLSEHIERDGARQVFVRPRWERR